MGAPLISIIVPVYNIGELLPRCIDSLINQTYKDIEIILIDDGSTDGSGTVCEAYGKQDRRIFVIHQDNAGLSAARNTGIQNSRAPYLLFVDSDDYIKPDSCERLIKVALDNNCDIVAAGEIRVVGETESQGCKRNLDTNTIYSGENFLVQSLKKGGLSMCAPYALYRRTLLIDNQHFFKQGILHEDELWTPQTYLFAQRVMCIDFNFYYHWFREGSITHTKDKTKNSRDLINTCFELYEVYKKLDNDARKYLNDYLCTIYLSAVYLGKNYKADKKFALKTARSAKNRTKVLLYAVSPRAYLAVRSKYKNK